MKKLTIWVLLLMLFAASHVAAQKNHTNFVVIFTDDMGYGDLSCFGHPAIQTPHLDKMAQEGMKMTQFYVGAPVCSPSRGSLITGKVPVRSGLYGNPSGVFFPSHKTGIPQSETTIAEVLKDAGYSTSCIGKWHLGHLPEYLPTNHGFDEYFGIPYSNDMDRIIQFDGSDWITPQITLAKEENYLAYNVPLMRDEKIIERPADQRTITKRFTEEAVAKIKSYKDTPFFIYLAHPMPHIPLFRSEEFKDVSLAGIYGDVIEEIDWSAGQILKTLKEEGLDKNTLVIFTSDNGPWNIFRTHGGSAGLLRGGKNTCYEGGFRVPAICWWPGTIKANSISPALSTTMDLLPTFAEISGAGLKADNIIDGVSLLPVLKGETENVRGKIPYFRRGRLYAYRKGPWKIHFYTYEDPYTLNKRVVEHERPLLYNLHEDPSEQYNLFPDHPEIVKELTEEARQYVESIEIKEPLIHW